MSSPLTAPTTVASSARRPRVTIAMPLYNDERFVGEALASILAQTHDDFALIIGDNASTDRSVEIVEAMAANDPRVRIVRRPRNVGVLENLNALATDCVTEYFMWAASDDVWHPEFVERTVAALDAEPGAAMAFGTYTFIDEQGLPYGGPRNFDFGGSTPIERVRRLARAFDDGCFYAMYRTRLAMPLRVLHWHGPNRVTPYNIAYPMLFGVLAKGDMAFVEGEPLWLNRIKENPRHAVPRVQGRLHERYTLALRQAELVVRSFAAIRSGSGSTMTAVRSAPSLVGRFVRNIR